MKFSLQRAIGKRSTTGYAGPLRTLIQDIETPAPDRVVIVTKEPTLIIPTYLSRSLSTEGMVLPKKYIEANGDDVFARKPVGSGPYKFVEQVTGSHIKLTAVDNHWRIGTPKYKNVTFRLVPEETTRIALLRRGEVDVAEVSRERVKELEKEGFPIHFRRRKPSSRMWWILGPDGLVAPDEGQAGARGPQPRHRPRRDRPGHLRGQGRSGRHPAGVVVVVQGHRLQGDAGDAVSVRSRRAPRSCSPTPATPSGFPLDVYAYQLPGLPEGKAFAEAVAGYWEKIGVKTKLIPVDYPAFRKNWVDRKTPGAVGYFNIANRDWIGTYALLEKQAYTPSKPNDTVNDPEVDAHDRAGHAPDRQGQDQHADAQHLHAAAERALRRAGGVPALGLCHRRRRSASGSPAP